MEILGFISLLFVVPFVLIILLVILFDIAINGAKENNNAKKAIEVIGEMQVGIQKTKESCLKLIDVLGIMLTGIIERANTSLEKGDIEEMKSLFEKELDVLKHEIDHLSEVVATRGEESSLPLSFYLSINNSSLLRIEEKLKGTTSAFKEISERIEWEINSSGKISYDSFRLMKEQINISESWEKKE